MIESFSLLFIQQFFKLQVYVQNNFYINISVLNVFSIFCHCKTWINLLSSLYHCPTLETTISLFVIIQAV